MADQPNPVPDLPDTTTSYSDPIYDRIEGFVNALGRRWIAVVLFVVAAAVAAVVVKQMANTSPVAAGAQAYGAAFSAEGADDLQAVAEDDTIVAEFRARAAVEAAARLLADGDLDGAKAVLSTGQAQAEASTIDELSLTVALSQAAVAEQGGALDEALAAYQRVQSATSTSVEPALNLQAAVSVGRVYLALAEAAAEPAAQAEHLEAARDALTYATDRSASGSEQLVRYARYLLAQIDLRYSEDSVVGQESEEEAEGEDTPVEGEDAPVEGSDEVVPADEVETGAEEAATPAE